MGKYASLTQPSTATLNKIFVHVIRQLTNVLTLVVSLFGFSFFVNTFGVRSSLMIFPCLLLTAVILANLVPTLWVLFFIVAILKASAYSLNDPIKELLYQPTSVPIKYKAKAWIDVFGSRLAKAGGSFITHLSHGSVARLQLLSELPSFLIATALIVVAWQAGTQFQHLVKNDLIVGECTEAEENDQTGPVPIAFRKKNQRPENNGLRPGDVGYGFYDPDEVFEGVFTPETDMASSKRLVSTTAPSSSRRHLNNDYFRNTRFSDQQSDGRGATQKKSFRDIKIRASAGASTSGKSAPERDIDGNDDARNRSESADF